MIDNNNYLISMGRKNSAGKSTAPVPKTTTNQINSNNNNQIKLLTYNVFIRPPGIKNNANDYKDERLECLVSEKLEPKKNSKIVYGPNRIPNTSYRVDKCKFPYIPFLSPWRTPQYLLGNNSLTNNDNSTSTEEFVSLSKSIIQEFDIICFQELFSAFSYRQRRFIQQAKTQGFLYSAASPLPPYFKSTFLVDGGLVVLSKYPIKETGYLLYTQGVDSDMLASKGVLYTKIQTSPDKMIHLFTTHLQASYAHPEVPGQVATSTTTATANPNIKNDSIRTIQLNQLRDFILSKTFDDQHTIILAGDLNVDGRTSRDNAKDSKTYIEMLDILCNTNKKYTSTLVDNNQLPASFYNNKKVFSVNDLLKQDCQGDHPPTVGDLFTTKQPTTNLPLQVPRETALTNPNDYGCMKRLDYILILNREFDLSSSNGASTSPVNIRLKSDTSSTTSATTAPIHLKDSTKVEPFFIEGFPFTQLSDHYGVSTILLNDRL
ncbi:hypothetical protein CYY_008778 [Polysphondylium violaceum]|uniref:sphingomyelin phosphodiesterase n=1 Tax=Polysphondylium violaceum TaxID=133409 RepID=A0A8J4PMW8_9MYCE|nr:hypothetical protein CYY_008778 [Polysphondylium violaceum]